jgi:hypothetical protein
VLPKTTPQQRSRFYRDVDDLISPGFLSHNVRVGRVRFSLRTLGSGDLFMLRYRSGDDLEDWQLWALASSVWMVNGHNILPNPELVPRLFDMFKGMHHRALRVFLSTFTGLLNRAGRAEEAVEPYMYESFARAKWRALGSNPHQQLHLGVPGAAHLGLNLIQQIWATFNDGEDTRNAFDNQWEGFKLVASSNSPKGVKKIDEKDTRQRQEENDRRQSVMDRYFYYRSGAVDRDGFIQNRDRDLVGSRVQGPKTNEQLEDEMKRWVSGEFDEHDQIVDGYKQRILDRQAEVERERDERRRRLAEEAERRQEVGFEPTPLVGFTQDQLAHILASRGAGQSSPGARFVYDDDYERAKKSVGRHVHRADPGQLAVQGGRVQSPTDPTRDIQTLQQMIEKRQVDFSDEAPPPPPPSSAPRGPKPEGVSQSDWDEHGGNVNPAVFGGQGRGDN